MRPAPSLQRAFASLLLVFYLAVTVFGGALVRCQEADGTVTIEWLGAACCLPDSAPTPGEPLGDAGSPTSDDAGCDGCRDEPLSPNAAVTAATRTTSVPTRATLPPAPHFELVLRPRFALHASPLSYRNASNASNPPPLTSPRTAVLRC